MGTSFQVLYTERVDTNTQIIVNLLDQYIVDIYLWKC
jgi:hypothetical protein